MAAQFVTDRPWQLAFPGDMGRRLHAHLFPGDHDEHGAVVLAGMARGADGSIRLLARELHLAKDGADFVPGQRGYRMLRAEFIRPLIRRARDEKLVYLAVHNHGAGTSVSFSPDDLASHERGYPALLDVADGMPIGALVFATEAIAGDIWLPGRERVELESAIVIGAARQLLRPAPLRQTFSRDPVRDRQARIFGDAGQAILRNARVAIIGLGGVGSLIAEQLGHLGVGHFLLIDPERLAASNRSRVVGATAWDAPSWLEASWMPNWLRAVASSWQTPKVQIARRIILRANRQAKVDARFADVRDPACATALTACDYIFLAADSMSARLIFNQIVHQYYIPGVQVGSKVQVNKDTGAVDDVFSVVRPVTPGHGCLWCNGLIDPARLQEEWQAEAEVKAQRYVDEPDVVAPSVITLNAVGAAHACNDFLFYITGLRRPEAELGYFRHHAQARRTAWQRPRKAEDCTECSGRLGRGSAEDLTVRE